jgi:excinuclease ABC subunit A
MSPRQAADDSATSPRPARLGAIEVKGCHVHNLRGVDVTIPHGSFTVVTGVSGSGKSSLAFDTVFAEGRRRYLESLSAYARQFVEQVPRPDVDAIDGLPPTVSIDQRSTRGGVRATVASMAEVLDYLRLLWARCGTRHCERCDRPVAGTSPDAIVDEIRAHAKRRRKAYLLAPLVHRRKGFHNDVFQLMARLGIERARVDGVAFDVDPETRLSRYHEHSIEALVAVARIGRDHREELEAGVQRALDRGKGTLYVAYTDDLVEATLYSAVAACADCGTSYGPLDPGDLSFSMRQGMCRRCRGRGVEPDDGDDPPPCRSCDGARLNPAARAVRFQGKGLHEVLALPVDRARKWLQGLEPVSPREAAVLDPVRAEVDARLAFVEKVGLSYLALDRGARTLSGGESQRVRLASQLGTGLRGVCYVLDEPTIGLHPRDNERLLATLRALCDRGATLLVVEHDEDTIRAADQVVDLGPGAGSRGGTVVSVGTPDEIAADPRSITGPWLAGTLQHDASQARPVSVDDPALVLRGVRARNLRGVDVRFPVGALTCVTGVSGSGKSTLVRHVLHPALLRALDRKGPEPGAHDALEGAEHVRGVLEIDQSPIGKTSRSVPATYTKIMDPLRALFAESPEARVRGFEASRFSFNSANGRCPECKGQGEIRVEMSFLPDVRVPCDVCDGARYDEETLAVRFGGRTIAEVLDMTVEEARPAFAAFPKIARVLDVMDEVGLGYLQLGQPSPTLSGGEAQRVKLSAEMARRGRGGIVYLLDEPTTGLHAADVDKLVSVLRGLVELGNTVVVIEHHLDVIAAADVVVDLGPGGGEDGGGLVAYGPPDRVAAVPGSATGQCLADRAARGPAGR